MVAKLKRPKQRPKSRSRNGISPTAEVFLAAFKSLPDEAQGEFLVSLLEDEEMREDIMDIAVIIARRNEPHRPLREILAESQGK